MTQLTIAVAVAVLSWSTAALAHHPFSADFDEANKVALKGTVTKVEWQSPHVYVYLDVKDSSGKMNNWKVEMGSPEAIGTQGWTRSSLKPGDEVTVEGWRAKNNSYFANADAVTLSDGRKMAGGSSFHMKGPEGELARGTSGAGEALPATASPLALFGLIGALALGGALGLRARRR
jgi:Family of unknown function (DUF6152)